MRDRRTWSTDARDALIKEHWPTSLDSAEIVRRVLASPGPPPSNPTKAVQMRAFNLGLARPSRGGAAATRRSTRWTADRQAYLRRTWCEGLPTRLILEGLNEMAGPAIDREHAVRAEASRLNLTRPPLRQEKPAVWAMPSPPVAPAPAGLAGPPDLMKEIYDYILTRSVKVNLVGPLTAADLAVVNNRRMLDDLPVFRLPQPQPQQVAA